jgi:hypothetical protein
MWFPAVRLREGDRIKLRTHGDLNYVPEYEVRAVSDVDEDNKVTLTLVGIHAAGRTPSVDAGALIEVVKRTQRDHLKVTWTLLDPMTGQLLEDRRTDDVDLSNARAHGRNDFDAIRKIVALSALGAQSYAEFVVILRVEEIR